MASKLELRSELVELLRTNKAEEAKRLLQRDESLTFSKDDVGSLVYLNKQLYVASMIVQKLFLFI